jgi:hypothetical protein
VPTRARRGWRKLSQQARRRGSGRRRRWSISRAGSTPPPTNGSNRLTHKTIGFWRTPLQSPSPIWLRRGAIRQRPRRQAAQRHVDKLRQLRDVPNAIVRWSALQLQGPTAPSKELLAGIERARSVAPGRTDYAFIHAQILARQSDFRAAQNVVAPLMSRVYPEPVRTAARQIMEYILELEKGNRVAAPAATAVDSSLSDSGEPARSFIVQPVFRELKSGEERLEGMLTRDRLCERRCGIRASDPRRSGARDNAADAGRRFHHLSGRPDRKCQLWTAQRSGMRIRDNRGRKKDPKSRGRSSSCRSKSREWRVSEEKINSWNKLTGGEAGIRTLDTAFRPYNGLANRRLQPLGHLTVKIFRTISASAVGKSDCAPRCAPVRRTFAPRFILMAASRTIASFTIAYRR